MVFLQEHGIDSYDDLEALSADATEQFNTLSQEIKACEARLNEIADLKKTIITGPQGFPLAQKISAVTPIREAVSVR